MHSLKSWHLIGQSDENEQSIPITAKRIDPAPGTHIIRYSSEIEDIEISHTAHSRQGFAVGAVLVAEWIQGRKGVLSMDDYLSF
jgi:4-hydroxy-tetrahydrodipicolinate reductase